MSISQCILIVAAIIAASVIGVSLTFPYREAWMLPTLTAGGIFLLAVIEFVRELRSARSGKEAKRKNITDLAIRDGAETAGVRQYLLASAWFVGLGLAIYLVGFLLAIPAFTIAFVKSFGKSWLAAVAMAVLITGLLYGIFAVALQVQLYKGLLFKYLGL